jgi:aspartate ammonia-lyase
MTSIQIEVHLHGDLARYGPGGRLTVEQPSNAQVRDVLRALGVPDQPRVVVGLNGTWVAAEQSLADGARLDVVRSMAGGCDDAQLADPARTRTEHDLLGQRQVPADGYYGVHTLRALENFPISGVPISRYPDLIRALADVKHAAAHANHALGRLDADRHRAIIRACADVRAGCLTDEFVVDMIQGGAGTSTNMNANEVLANRGLEYLGRRRGAYDALHPIEHVNMSQSTNDVYPTAIRIALCVLARRLLESMAALRGGLAQKAGEFDHILKLGRTQLQDAVSMTLGQEFRAFAVMVQEDEQRLSEVLPLLCEINLGATAIGTGITAPDGYAAVSCRTLAELTGLPLVTAGNLVEATQDAGVFVHLSGVLKRIAVKLSKTCNDLRLLSSGPSAGLGEINLPPMQA